MSEQLEQTGLFGYLSLLESRFPCLKWVHHIPNGGLRNKRTASSLKRQGVKKGVWDIFLPHEAGSSGLYIEMKDEGIDKKGRHFKKSLTAEQKEFRDYAVLQGFKCIVCYSAEEALIEILKYIGTKPSEVGITFPAFRERELKEKGFEL